MLYRTLGLGYAALGELLVMLGLGYGSIPGREYAAELTSTMTAIAYLTSTELAEQLGAFPRFEANREHVLTVLGKHRDASSEAQRSLWNHVLARAGRVGTRNAQVSLLAPTGTIGIEMDCETTGVEPYYSDMIVKLLAGGGYMKLAAKRFAEYLTQRGLDVAACTRNVFTVEGGKVREYTWLEPPKHCEHVLVCADSLLPEQHIAMMAAVQPFLSGAISKTINMPSTATVEDVGEMYSLAHRSGLKSVAIYRDGCKPSQPMQGRMPAPGMRTFATRAEAEQASSMQVVGGVAVVELGFGLVDSVSRGTATTNEVVDLLDGRKLVPELHRGQRVNPPQSARGTTETIELNGHTFYLTLNEHTDGTLAAVFVIASRTGSTTSGWVNAWAKTFSLALQHGTPLDVLVSAMRGEMFEPGGYHDGHFVSSPVDAFARIIEQRYLTPVPEQLEHVAERSTSAHAPVVPTGKPTGSLCAHCGNPTLVRAGSCFVCTTCATTTGCS
jgi:ribonucleoside-diphosphate reductase alpha chain